MEEIKEKKKRTNKKVKERGNGEGTIYWSEALQCYVGQYVNKKTGVRKTLKQRKNETPTEFKKRYNNEKHLNDNGLLLEKSNTTLINILEEHIEYKNETNLTSDRTYARDQSTLKQIKKNCSDICNIPIQKVTVSNIKKITPNITKYSQASINKIWCMLCKGFKIAVSDGLMIFNPMENINVVKPKSIKPSKTVEALTTEEQKKFIKILKSNEHEYNDILLLQLQTGLRIGETLALSKDCINLKEETITIYRTLTQDKNYKFIMGKNPKTFAGNRTIYMTEQTKLLCKKILSNKITNIEGLLFFDYKENTFITPNEINSYLSRLNQKYNIAPNLHSHMLRHTFATRFIEAGGSAKVLQKILGHANIKTTLDKYTSVFDKFNKNETEKYVTYMKELGM